MADAPKSDADCIQAAYEDAMQANFKQLMGALVAQGEDEALGQFSKAVQLTRNAKALGAINAPLGAAAAEAPAPKRQRKSKP